MSSIRQQTSNSILVHLNSNSSTISTDMNGEPHKLRPKSNILPATKFLEVSYGILLKHIMGSHLTWRLQDSKVLGDRCEIPTQSRTCLPGYCAGGSVCHVDGEGRMKCSGCQHDQRQEADERCRLSAISFHGKGALHIEEKISRIQWIISFRSVNNDISSSKVPQ